MDLACITFDEPPCTTTSAMMSFESLLLLDGGSFGPAGAGSADDDHDHDHLLLLQGGGADDDTPPYLMNCSDAIDPAAALGGGFAHQTGFMSSVLRLQQEQPRAHGQLHGSARSADDDDDDDSDHDPEDGELISQELDMFNGACESPTDHALVYGTIANSNHSGSSSSTKQRRRRIIGDAAAGKDQKDDEAMATRIAPVMKPKRPPDESSLAAAEAAAAAMGARELHVQCERQRRKCMSETFALLHSLVPSLAKLPKVGNTLCDPIDRSIDRFCALLIFLLGLFVVESIAHPRGLRCCRHRTG
jgi:hypothetical protein